MLIKEMAPAELQLPEARTKEELGLHGQEQSSATRAPKSC